jgi:serine/threonine-protein kinase HipA
VQLVGAGRDDELALLVERYDIPDQEALARLAPDLRLALQEDACSLLLLPRGRKYDPSLERIAAKLVELGLNTHSMDVFLRHVAFSWIVGNGDLHAKNISIVRRVVPGQLGTAPSLERVVYSPLYDLVCTRLAIRDDQFALPLAGKRHNLRPGDFGSWGARWGADREKVQGMLAELATRVRAHMTEVLEASRLSADDQARYVEIVRNSLQSLGM